MFLWILCIILSLIVLFLLYKIYTIHKALRDICALFDRHLIMDTNTLITVSSGDRHIKKLAGKLNEELKVLHGQRRKYLQGDQALKEAVTNISHDLRTPLTAVSGYLELLAKEELSEDAARYLSCIRNRTKALKSLSEELFRYTISLRGEKMTLESLDIRTVLEESLLDLYGEMVQKEMEPEVQLPEVPVIRQLNRTALSRIFTNILQNALKYGTSPLSISLDETGEILFRNPAPSLDQVQVGKLFNRYFTVENGKNSTGLGLSIAKTLVQEMKGEIHAEYKENRLSIRILFPKR